MNIEENKKIMAANIKRYMERKGISNQKLCDDLGFKYTTFMDWIKGVTYPRIGKVEAMAHYFGCEKSDLIENKDSKPTETDGLDKKDLRLLEWFRSLPEEKQKAILSLGGAPEDLSE